MRDRHNIVGSEVGRPRPPIYTLRTLKIERRRGGLPWGWIMAATVVAAIAALSQFVA